MHSRLFDVFIDVQRTQHTIRARRFLLKEVEPSVIRKLEAFNGRQLDRSCFEELVTGLATYNQAEATRLRERFAAVVDQALAVFVTSVATSSRRHR